MCGRVLLIVSILRITKYYRVLKYCSSAREWVAMPERRCPGCSPAGQRWPGAGGKKPQGGPHSLTQSPLFFLLLSALFLSELPDALFHLTLCLFVSSLWPLQIWSNQITSEKQESQYNVGKKSSSTSCIETFRLKHFPLDRSFISGENHIHHKRHKFTEYIRCNMQIVSSQTFANYFRLSKKCDLWRRSRGEAAAGGCASLGEWHCASLGEWHWPGWRSLTSWNSPAEVPGDPKALTKQR